MKKLTVACLMSTVSVILCNPSQAQTNSEASASEDSDVTGEIIVTAQRRDEGLSKTPVAVSVLSADTISNAQLTTEQDLRAASPGLSVRPTLNSNQVNYSLRGQSLDAFSGSAPGVLPYFNEIQIGGSGGSTAFFDVQSIQVLKGPQGTLFGRSATGGAVLITSAKPTKEFSGFIAGSIGNYDAVKIEGVLSGPIAGENLLARVGGFYQYQQGFQRNGFDGSRPGKVDRFGLRGSLTAEFGSVRNELVVDYLKSDNSSLIGVISGIKPFTGGGPGNPPFLPGALLYAGVGTPVAQITGQCTVQAFAFQTACPPVNPAVSAFYNAYFADPRRNPNGLAGVFTAQQARGPYLVDSDNPNFYKTDNLVISNVTAIDLNDTLTLKNIFGYVRLDNFNTFDGDGSAYGLVGNGPAGSTAGFIDNTRQISNEVQLQASDLGGRLDLITGLYFARDKITALHAGAFFDVIFGGFGNQTDSIKRNTTYAGYAQGTYRLNDNGLSVTAGLRYTSEKVGLELLPTDSLAQVFCFGAAPVPGYDCDQSSTYKKLSWQFGIQNQMDDVLLYAVTRRSNKSGGYNSTLAPLVGTAATGGSSFAAERVTDVEAGAKFLGRIGGRPASLNVAVYHIWTDNNQRTAFSVVQGSPATLTVNVPKGTTFGVELDGRLAVTDWLTIGGSYNYTNARVTDGQVIANLTPVLFDQIPDTPKSSGMIYADVTVPVSGDMQFTLHGDLYGQTGTTISPSSANSFGTNLKGYVLANFRAGIGDSEAGWSLTANVKNAFDKLHYAGGIPSADLFGPNLILPGAPRTFTVEARFKF